MTKLINSKQFAKKVHQEANHYCADGQLDAAIEVFYQGIKKYPNKSSLYCGLGGVFLKKQNWQPALRSYQKSLALNPENANSYYGLGTTLSFAGQRPLSIFSYLHAIYLGLASSYMSRTIGQIFEKLASQFLGDSIDDCCNALEEAGRSFLLFSQLSERQKIEFYTQAANLLDRDNYYTGATILYKLALKYDRANEMLIQKYQNASIEREQEREQKETYIQKIKQNPDSIDLQMKLANLYAKLGYLEEAKHYYLRIAKLRGWNQPVEYQYEFTNDYFTHNIPNWWFHLQKYQDVPNLNFLEIGSYQGMSTCWLLDNILTHDSAKLTCLDLQFQPVFYPNVQKTGSARKVIARMGASERTLRTLETDSYDAIYIDGSHLSVAVFQDALLSWPLIKVDGLVIFDDYRWTDPDFPSEDPKIGIDAFIDLFSNHLEIIHKDYQLMVKKKSNMEGQKQNKLLRHFDRPFKNANQLQNAISAYTS